MSDLDGAEAIFLRALELKPDNQKTHFYLGNIYEKKTQYYNAIFQYRKAGANIMVKRVQEKIDLERPSEEAQPAKQRHDTFPTPNPEDTTPPRAISEAMLAMGATAGVQSPDTLEKINVDHIDRHRFLTALQQGLFRDRPPQDPGTVSDETSPNLEIGPGPPRPTTKALETQEEILSAEDQAVIAETLDRIAPNEETRPSTTEAIPDSKGTRLRLTEPLLPDQSLEDAASKKVPEQAGSELFSDRRHRERRERAPATAVPRAKPISIGERDAHGHPQHIHWRAAGEAQESRAQTQMRRRDDTFRYLENNLMEVNFSGKVFIKQGTIYSYSGNLTFWVKPRREKSAPALVIVSGTGKLLLTDRQRDITVLQIDDEEIFVEPSHLLACEETLTPQYAVIEKHDGDPTGSMQVLVIKGTGVIALSVATSPLVMEVQTDYPVNVSSTSLISWSGNLTPTLVEDEALAAIMQPGPEAGVTLRLEGDGKVMMEKSAPR